MPTPYCACGPAVACGIRSHIKLMARTPRTPHFQTLSDVLEHPSCRLLHSSLPRASAQLRLRTIQWPKFAPFPVLASSGLICLVVCCKDHDIDQAVF